MSPQDRDFINVTFALNSPRFSKGRRLTKAGNKTDGGRRNGPGETDHLPDGPRRFTCLQSSSPPAGKCEAPVRMDQSCEVTCQVYAPPRERGRHGLLPSGQPFSVLQSCSHGSSISLGTLGGGQDGCFNHLLTSAYPLVQRELRRHVEGRWNRLRCHSRLEGQRGSQGARWGLRLS